MTDPIPLSERYGLALTVFAAWRVNISHTDVILSKILKCLSRSKVKVMSPKVYFCGCTDHDTYSYQIKSLLDESAFKFKF